MKKTGILNRQLATEFAKLGHTQLVVVADCGLPCPPNVPVVDLSVKLGLPRFQDVTMAILDELVVEDAWIAEEILSANPMVSEYLSQALVQKSYISHEELKAMLPNAAVIVRTGEATPYANVVLQCGVPF